MGNDVTEIQKMAETFRGAADILDTVAANIEDKTISRDEKEKKQDELMERFMRQMLKIQEVMKQ